MKKRYLFMLPAMSFAASTSAMSQAVADVPAAAKVNKTAKHFEAGDFSKYYDMLAKLIDDAAKDAGEEGIDGKKILNVLGLDAVKSYAQSSAPEGKEWVNLMYAENGGSEKGIFALLGKKNTNYVVPTMAPAGTDLAFQVRADLKTVEALITQLMEVGGASDRDKEQFAEGMQEEIPMLGMTTSQLLKKLNVRLNVVLDLDATTKLALPMVGEIEKPRLAIRVDGIAWMWEKIEPALMQGAGVPFQKAEENGVITYTLPDEMLGMAMGYSPRIVVDTKKNHIWIASSGEFFAKCTSGKNTLADSPEFKAAMKGLPKQGNILSYVSKDLAQFIVKQYENAGKRGQLDGLPEETIAEVDKAIDKLKDVEKGAVSVIAKDATGIHFASRATENIEKMIEEMKAALQKAKNM